MTDELRSHKMVKIRVYPQDQDEPVWDHSDFPHPLVTFDYDTQDNLYSITAFQPNVRLLEPSEFPDEIVNEVANMLADKFTWITTDVADLEGTPEPSEAQAIAREVMTKLRELGWS
jgi:hypothetical protein